MARQDTTRQFADGNALLDFVNSAEFTTAVARANAECVARRLAAEVAIALALIAAFVFAVAFQYDALPFLALSAVVNFARVAVNFFDGNYSVSRQ
jgi:hypothetical protein